MSGKKKGKVYKVTGNYKDIVTHFMPKGNQAFVDEENGSYLEGDVQTSREAIANDLHRENLLLTQEEINTGLNTINNFSHGGYAQGHFSGASATIMPAIQLYGLKKGMGYYNQHDEYCNQFDESSSESGYATAFKENFNPSSTYDISFGYLSNNTSIDGISFASYGYDNQVWLMAQTKAAQNLDDCQLTIYYSEKFYHYLTQDLDHNLSEVLDVEEVSIKDVQMQLQDAEQSLTMLQSAVKNPLDGSTPALPIGKLVSSNGYAIDNTSSTACNLKDNFETLVRQNRIDEEDKSLIISDDKLKELFNEDFETVKNKMGNSPVFTNLVLAHDLFLISEGDTLLNRIEILAEKLSKDKLTCPHILELINKNDKASDLINNEEILNLQTKLITVVENKTTQIASYWKINDPKRIEYGNVVKEYKNAVYNESLRVFSESANNPDSKPEFNMEVIRPAQEKVEAVLEKHRHPWRDRAMSVLTNVILAVITAGIFNVSHAIVHRDKNKQQGNLVKRIGRSVMDGELLFFNNANSQRCFNHFKRELQCSVMQESQNILGR